MSGLRVSVPADLLHAALDADYAKAEHVHQALCANGHSLETCTRPHPRMQAVVAIMRLVEAAEDAGADRNEAKTQHADSRPLGIDLDADAASRDEAWADAMGTPKEPLR